MAQDWDIKPRGNTCAACDEAFADRDECCSALSFTEDGYVRADYCTACWANVSPDGTPVSTWQGPFLAPPPKEEEALKKETAESLLRRLMEDEDEANTNVIYILAVMLERKRIFVERDVKTLDDGRIIRVYEQRKTGETFLINDPRLQLDQLETVQQEVVTLLGGGSGKDEAGETAEGEASTSDDATSSEAETQPAPPVAS